MGEEDEAEEEPRIRASPKLTGLPDAWARPHRAWTRPGPPAHRNVAVLRRHHQRREAGAPRRWGRLRPMGAVRPNARELAGTSPGRLARQLPGPRPTRPRLARISPGNPPPTTPRGPPHSLGTGPDLSRDWPDTAQAPAELARILPGDSMRPPNSPREPSGNALCSLSNLSGFPCSRPPCRPPPALFPAGAPLNLPKWSARKQRVTTA